MPGAGCAFATATPNIIMIYTDDHGYADIGANGVVDDIRTPNIDSLAADGVRMTAGYVSAPQCGPSRAGLMTGRYQERFGLDYNGQGPLRKSETTIARRLKEAGYVTGMVGKWHLAPEWHRDRGWLKKNAPQLDTSIKNEPPEFEKYALSFSPNAFGFSEYFWGLHNKYRANYTLAGDGLDEETVFTFDTYRVDTQSEAALTFIDRNHKKPFFLYLAYYAPHVPLEAPEKYLSRFPRSAGSGQAGEMPTRRRYALAMISAMDDGVGRIREKLRRYGIDDNTLVFFIGDNGAPTKIDKEDKPLSVPLDAWDGSVNDPWVGEKGMVTDGGVRVPYLVCWPEKIPAGQVYGKPVLQLDATATALAAAGIDAGDSLDGVDLMPYLTGVSAEAPHEDLYWRFWNQAAVRSGRWKYLCLPDGRRWLFDMESEEHERKNRIGQYPEIAESLHKKLKDWCDEQENPGLPDQPLNNQEVAWFEHYLPSEK
jgi:arylsulfatase A-like enzyme